MLLLGFLLSFTHSISIHNDPDARFHRVDQATRHCFVKCSLKSDEKDSTLSGSEMHENDR